MLAAVIAACASSQAHNHSSVCILTMANEFAWRKYERALRSQTCYAKRHGYTYIQESVPTFIGRAYGHTLEPSRHKPAALRKLLNDPRCRWVFWLDADIFIVQGHRRLEEWLDHDATLVIRDDHSVIGNPAFALRAHWPLTDRFMDLWERETREPKYPLTDNGSMFEAMLQTFVPGYSPFACCREERRAGLAFSVCNLGHLVDCTMKTLLGAFGKTHSKVARGGNGLRLVPPGDSFYGYSCLNKGGTDIVHCNTPGATMANMDFRQHVYNSLDYSKPGQILGVAKLADQFTPPNPDGSSTGLIGNSFAFHSKVFPLPQAVLDRAFSCKSKAMPDCTCDTRPI